MKDLGSSKIKGFTLIELIVVMGIFTVLSTLAVGGWIALRRQSEVDNVAETYINAVRDSQNKAFAVTKDGAYDTFGWAVALTDGGTHIAEYSLNATAATTNFRRTIKQTPVNSVLIDIYPGTYSAVGFMTPFGKGYSLNTSSGALTEWSTKADASRRPALDHYPAIVPIDTNVEIRFSKGGYLRKIILQPNGDVYAE